MKKYTQLNPEQRYQISALLNTSFNKTQIALIIGVHRSTVYREIKRNIPSRGRTADQYVPSHAQDKTNRRHAEKRKRIILTKNSKFELQD